VILTLELGAPHGANPGVRTRQVFDEKGGTIGRDGKNSWVLPDREVSGRHAQISYRNNVFYIEDTNSTNGISINSAENRLLPARRYPLTSGDRVFIRPYVISVEVSESADRSVQSFVQPSPGPDPFFTGDPFVEGDAARRGDSPLPPPSVPESPQELNPLNLIPGPPLRTPARTIPDAKGPGGGSLLEAHYRPPEAISPAPAAPPPAKESIPHDYNPLIDDSSLDVPLVDPPPLPRPHAAAPVSPRSFEEEPPLTPPPTPTPTPTPTSPLPVSRSTNEPPPTASSAGVRHIDVKGLLEGAGIDGSLATEELERTFGEILRVVVAGMMEVLRARQEIKDEFRMHVTQFRPTENNPLKFSANVEDALHNLLVKRNPAYLEPVQAFAEAFEDLRHHQLAILEGMRAAFEAMLEEFDPDRLQKEFDKQVKSGALLSVPAKLRYWDLYRDRCRDMVQDKDASFRKLFGEEFAEAYEVQLRRLKAAARSRSQGVDSALDLSRKSEE
jgi:type VI secretion system FHA domain protein